MTALLIDNLPLLGGAPNGIQKLRELILELAVRGMLVPQDASEEPANELLKRIAAEKARLVAAGKLKKHTAIADVSESEKPFALPAGWTWAFWDTIALKIGDIDHKMPETKSEGVPFVSPRDFYPGNVIDFDGAKRVSIEDFERLSAKIKAERGDLIYPRYGTIGENILVNVECDFLVSYSCAVIKVAHGFIDPVYQFYVSMSAFIRKQAKAAENKTTQANVGIKSIQKYLFPVPPLSEQHRIVAKVDALMALCNRLETQQADAESAHAQLSQALLDSLTQASEVADFASNWERLAEHFHTLFTTELSIDAFKQTLLQLAVMGRLVPQDSSDESANKLLKRIAEAKARLVTEGKIRKQKPLTEIAEDEKLFELQTGWEWSRLGSLVVESGAGWSPSCESRPREGTEWGVLKVSAVSWSVYQPEENKALPMNLDARPEYEVTEGDFLITRANTAELVARSVVVDKTPSRLMLSDKIVRLKLTNWCDSHYVNLINSTTYARQYYARVAGGTSSSMKNVSREQILNLPIALPPLAEQHRIVAKFNQLIALCDQLKTRLIHARQLNEQLAITMVERALAEPPKQTPVVTDCKVARTLLAAEITHRLYDQRTFGQRKLQKVIYLAEHAAKLAAIQGDYLRNVAGPHDRLLMKQVEGELHKHQWYERIDRDTVGHAYRPLASAGQHRQPYESTWSSAERSTIERVIELMRIWDTDRCEMTVTLYAAWNDFILEGRPSTDEAIVDEVMHRWNDAKLRFSKSEWLAVLADMKNHEILMPTGFGKRTTGGMLSLPGFE